MLLAAIVYAVISSPTLFRQPERAVNIEDRFLREAIRSETGGNAIYYRELVELTSLSISGWFILDIADLRHCVNLEILDLSDNRIKTINTLAYLKKLDELNLAGNQIQDIRPLIDNNGISKGDLVILEDNSLNAEPVNTYIPQLQARGVEVRW